jgi:death-on-curing protein
MKQPKWLLKEVVLAVHQKTLREQGGLPGIRDVDLLESALARPVNAFNYAVNPNIHELAAAYGYGVAMNHAFYDGNKRVAFYASVGFLRINGFALTATELEAATTFLGLAAGQITEEELTDWFSRNTVEM